MAYRLKILPIALKDITEVIERYENERTGIGDDFRQKVNATIKYIGNHPHQFQKRNKEIRISLISGFPYVIYFLTDDMAHIVIIVGILHMSRNLDISRRRLE